MHFLDRPAPFFHEAGIFYPDIFTGLERNYMYFQRLGFGYRLASGDYDHNARRGDVRSRSREM